MAWNDVYTRTSDLSDIDLWTMFYDAFDERHKAIGNAGGTPFAAPAVDGDWFQDSDGFSRFTLAAMQQMVSDLAPSFVAPTADPVASYDGLVAASLPTYSLSSLITSINGNTHFTRKYPREFTDLTATEYTDTNAFADGHKARCIADTLVYVRESDSGGNHFWTLTSDLVPDTVTTTGYIEPGDYVGHWHFNEIRDCLNKLLWYYGGATGVGTDYLGQSGGVTAAAAQAGAEADYQLVATTGGGPLALAEVVSTFQATLRRAAMAATTPLPTFANSQVVLFVRAESFSGPGMTFDDNGDTAIVQNTIKHVETGSVANTSPWTGAVTIGTTAMPDRWNRGYDGHWHVLVRWDVAGGFQYVP